VEGQTPRIPTDLVTLPSYPSGMAINSPTLVMPGLASVLSTWLAACIAGQGVAADESARYASLGESWAIGLPQYTLGTLILPPNPKISNCDHTGGLANPGMFNMSSYHPGGANALFCDGSVKFLKDSTNQTVIWALGSRGNGEIVSSDSY
jgi:prepilin-type processing-associated H-X9-DG protein